MRISFTSETKEELSLLAAEQSPCCQDAQLYGMLLFGKRFSIREVAYLSDQLPLADFVKKLLERIAPIAVTQQKNGRKWEINVPSAADRRQVLDYFGHTSSDISLRIQPNALQDDCCKAAFLRGVFFSCATMTAPQLQYHLAFCGGFRNLTEDLAQMLEQLGFSPKRTQRKGSWILYLKDSGEIEDFLTYLGAQTAPLALMQVKIEKSVRNHVNRKVNFENANLSRTVNAAFLQCQAIQALRAHGRLDSLSPPLRQAARLREENPEASLDELCAMSGDCARSTMHHRFKRLMELANIQKENTHA
ncbi:MAG: DNA-binding protein WhiA [Oscillospiraceae bacterium]|nr:DNA-binding protein WhiA [Oscillospiraceae bacterium]